MSEYSVSFVETFIVEAASKEEAIAIAQSKYPFNSKHTRSIDCEIVPKLMKETA
jgi:hypothetical protein